MLTICEDSMTPTEWAVEAFKEIQKEWAAQADFESARRLPTSAKTKRLQALMMKAPVSVKRKVLTQTR